jgi:hypothetical protein
MKIIILFFAVLLTLSCTKPVTINRAARGTGTDTDTTRMTLEAWLIKYAKSRPIGSDGVIAYDAVSVKLNDTAIVNRGVWYYDPNPRPDLIYPSIHEYMSPTSGVRREIELGTTYEWCDQYTYVATKVTLYVTAGAKQIFFTGYPILLSHPRTTQVLNWPVQIPKRIDIVLSPKSST